MGKVLREGVGARHGGPWLQRKILSKILTRGMNEWMIQSSFFSNQHPNFERPRPRSVQPE